MVTFNVFDISSISGMTYSGGEVSLPAGTYMIYFLARFNTIGSYRYIGYQYGSNISPSTNFTNAQFYVNLYSQRFTTSYCFVFTSTTLFRIWTSGDTSATVDASSSILTIIKIA